MSKKDTSKNKEKYNERKSFPRYKQQMHYLIVTTGKKTEINYFEGFRKNLDDEKKEHINISYKICPIGKIIKKADSGIYKNPHSKIWLVFDTDKDTNIIQRVVAEANNKGYNIAFSNPCIEIWFLAYFGKSPTHKNNQNLTASKECIKDLKTHLPNYEKNNEKIYEALITAGDEIKAIEVAKNRHENHENIDILEMYGATSVYQLIEEIRKIPTTTLP